MIVGFANPHIPLEQSKEGVNVVLVVDVSGSMQGQTINLTDSRLQKILQKFLLDRYSLKITLEL